MSPGVLEQSAETEHRTPEGTELGTRARGLKSATGKLLYSMGFKKIAFCFGMLIVAPKNCTAPLRHD
jgi:hypothetical protein